MKIVIVGLGYVGISNAIVLAQKHSVIGVDVDVEKLAKLENKQSPLSDEFLQDFLRNERLDLKYSRDLVSAICEADLIIVATPTDYNEVTNYFDTSTVETVIETIVNSEINATIVVKSTIPIGFIDRVRAKFGYEHILFSPEFLREGAALWDNLYPSRIVVGDSGEHGRRYADLMLQCCKCEKVETLFVGTKDAEAIKLFANSYLAMRVAFFNEVDTFAYLNGCDAKNIIEGVCLDPRIGADYNNPSFGYGGYCLPKDTKQLLANYSNTPQEIISAIVNSNQTRKSFIIDEILEKKPGIVGIHRLAMKSESDNFRQAAVLDIMNELRKHNVDVLIFEPALNDHEFDGVKVEKSFDTFCARSDIIVTNRMSEKLFPFKGKVFTRDVFGRS